MNLNPTPIAISQLFCAMFIMTIAMPTAGALVSRFIVLIERRATALAQALTVNARCAGTRTGLRRRSPAPHPWARSGPPV